MNSKRNPNDNYSDGLENLFKEIIPTLELLFGKQMPENKRKEIENILDRLRLPATKYARHVDDLKVTGNMAQLANLSDEFLKELIPDIPSGTSGFEYIQESLFKPGKIEISYIKESKYDDYLRCIEDIVNTGVDQHLAEVNSYLFSVDKIEADNLAWAQPIGTDMARTIKFLSNDRKRFSSKLAYKCVIEYSKMSGIYERLIKIIAGFVSVESNKLINYSEFRKKGLSKCICIVNEKGRDILTQGFEVKIRNSIAHKSYIFNTSTKSVDFTDSNPPVLVSVPYAKFFQKTRELSCLLLALSQFRGLVSKKLLSTLSQHLSR